MALDDSTGAPLRPGFEIEGIDIDNMQVLLANGELVPLDKYSEPSPGTYCLTAGPTSADTWILATVTLVPEH